MSEPTHEEVLAAIDEAAEMFATDEWLSDWVTDLRATAERHAPVGSRWPVLCHCESRWPCPDYRQIIDRLTAWGVL
jgi:hypothetical protein